MVDLLGHLKSPIGITVAAAVCVYMRKPVRNRPLLSLQRCRATFAGTRASRWGMNTSEHVAVMELKLRLGFCVASLSQ